MRHFKSSSWFRSRNLSTIADTSSASSGGFSRLAPRAAVCASLLLLGLPSAHAIFWSTMYLDQRQSDGTWHRNTHRSSLSTNLHRFHARGNPLVGGPASPTGSYAWGEARASGKSMGIRGGAAATVLGSFGQEGAFSHVQVAMFDTIRVDKAGMEGQTGRLVGRLKMKAEIDARDTGAFTAKWGKMMAAWSTSPPPYVWNWERTAIERRLKIDQWIDFSVGFRYGESTTLRLWLGGEAFIEAVNYGSSRTRFDSYQSLTWGGITGFYDEHDNLVTGVNMWSESGTDWKTRDASLVPGPAAALMFGTLLVQRFRRRSACC
jgi:hypothetical protein